MDQVSFVGDVTSPLTKLWFIFPKTKDRQGNALGIALHWLKPVFKPLGGEKRSSQWSAAQLVVIQHQLRVDPRVASICNNVAES